MQQCKIGKKEKNIPQLILFKALLQSYLLGR